MTGIEWILELGLVVLLLVTMIHARRLERALGVLKQDRAMLQALVAEFNDSAGAAERGIERLRDAAESAGRQLTAQAEAARGLKDDLAFLATRGETLADRLEVAVKASKLAPAGQTQPPHLRSVDAPAHSDAAMPAVRQRSQAERDLMHALRLAR